MKIFRIDDIGASTKQYEQYARWRWANFWFLKRIWPFKKWGPYKELTAKEWRVFLEIFRDNNIEPIISITACWVEENSSLTPFHEKFSEEANVLKQASDRGDIIIANHGLTHCIVGKHLPLFRYPNRKLHREFYPAVPLETQKKHIQKSQEILENYFEKTIDTLVPPGNVWSQNTVRACQGTNIKKIICAQSSKDIVNDFEGIEFIDDKQDYFAFHDRELKLYEKKWLLTKINELQNE